MTRPDGALNFGDDLAPLVCSYAWGRPCERADLGDCDVIGLGSLLQEAVRSSRRRGLVFRSLILRRARPMVWGTGIIDARPVASARHLNVLSLRGPLTAASIAPGCTSFGDPGLLVGEMFQERTKRHAVGIVPHYVDEDSPAVAALLDRLPGARRISVNAPAMDVVRAISECEVILSSSLHGLIVADALGIPNARLSFSDRIKGGDFKFADYGASVGRGSLLAEPDPMSLTPRSVLARDFTYQSGIPRVAKAIRAAALSG
jgi:hypothetical protein